MGIDAISSVTMPSAPRIDGYPGAPKAIAEKEAAPLPKKHEANRDTKNDAAPAHASLEASVEAVNEKLSRTNRRIDIYLVEDSHEVAARVVDTESNEVVKYIPPKELLELRNRLDKMVGFLFDKGA
jgi:flagellar protein FlaG